MQSLNSEPRIFFPLLRLTFYSGPVLNEAVVTVLLKGGNHLILRSASYVFQNAGEWLRQGHVYKLNRRNPIEP